MEQILGMVAALWIATWIAMTIQLSFQDLDPQQKQKNQSAFPLWYFVARYVLSGMLMWAIYYKIDLSRLKSHIKPGHMTSDSLMEMLQYTVQRPMKTYSAPIHGIWLIIQRTQHEIDPDGYKPYLDIYPQKRKLGLNDEA